MKIIAAFALLACLAAAPVLAQADTRGSTSTQAENRRFIKVGMTRAEVIASIGRPDRTHVQTADRTQAGVLIPTGDQAIYEPRAGDDQTRTTVHYIGDVVNLVQRDVVRKP
jgi:hypothetical protein